jgi:hypothetical protein
MATSLSPNAGPLAKLHATFEQFETLLRQKMRPPPPQLGDGRYNEEAIPEPVPTGLANDLAALGFDVPKDLGTLIELIESQFKGVTDDKKYLVCFLLTTPLTVQFGKGKEGTCRRRF